MTANALGKDFLKISSFLSNSDESTISGNSKFSRWLTSGTVIKNFVFSRYSENCDGPVKYTKSTFIFF